MKNIFRLLRKRFVNTYRVYEEAAKDKATETLEIEINEMENVFSLLVLGSFVGLPAPPMQITLDLLPDMEKQFQIMLNKVEMANSPISDLLSTFDVL